VTPIVGSGERKLQPIWVDDVAAYFTAAVDEPAAANRTFELGGPDVVSWNDFWDRLKRSRGLRRPTLHIPTSIMRAQASVLERLPRPPVTRDQLTMLEAGDNVVTDASAVETFKLPLVPLDEQLRRAAAAG
jgi:NADH dehydrogenase